MSKFRNVSADNTSEAREVNVNGSYLNSDESVGLSVGNISTWANETDFITYARDSEGKVDEDTRIIWTGQKTDDTYIVGKRVGGSESYLPDSTNFATVVPTHLWANDLIDALKANLAGDGERGLLVDGSASPLIVSVAATRPAAKSGRIILWLRPLV